MRKKISIALKFTIGVFSLLGVFVACFFATRDGYSHWYKRLFYFTQQSNIWIGVTSLVMAIMSVIGMVKKKEKPVKDYWYILKFVFTVSITITGIIFCALLAPFATEDYNAWSFSSLMTHVFVPILSIVDLFVDCDNCVLKKRHVFYSLIPPIVYFIFALILGFKNIDFGRGDPFPYFFLDFDTDAGLFGYVDGNPPMLGSFYWIILISLLVLGLSFLYYRLHPSTWKARKSQSK